MNALTINIRRKQFRSRGKAPSHMAIEGLSLSVQEREFVCILGPSGCGKTTMLNLIAGLDKDYEGEIEISRSPQRRLAYVFQTPRLLPWRTVLDNVRLAVGDDSASLEAARSLLSEVGLSRFENSFPGQVSVGMQRRAALARAFAFRPGILLMDEPFVSLDEPSADRLRNLLAALWREHPTTVLFVTHDVREAIRLGDRLVMLSRAPAKVAREVTVRMSASQRCDSTAVESFRNEVLGGVDETFFRTDPDHSAENGL